LSLSAKRYVAISLVLLLLIIPFLPIRVSYTFDGIGRIYPTQEWILEKGTNGGLSSTLHNHRDGIIGEVTNYQFERGDIARVNLSQEILDQGFVSKGDTLAKINSFLLEQNLTVLQNRLRVEKARLKRDRAGDKPPVIAEARRALEFATERRRLAEINFERQRVLYDSAVISLEEFQQAENAFSLADIQVKINESELASAEIGEKPEEIELTITRIKALENDIAFLKSKRQGYQIVAPTSGKITENTLPLQVVSIVDTQAWIIVIPVELQHQDMVAPGKKVQVSLPGENNSVEANIISVSRKVEILDSRQVFLVRAAIESTAGSVYRGTLTSCKFDGGKIILREYLARIMGQWKR
jgi:hypothetical protein